MFRITPGNLSLDDVHRCLSGRDCAFSIVPDCWQDVNRANRLIDGMSTRGEAVYGVTTGFGANAAVAIPQAQQAELQRRLVLSHCTGVGDLMPDEIVWLIMVLCVDSLPTSANQEDHISMSTFAARRLLEMARNSAHIVAIELLAACQGIDFRPDVAISPALMPAYALVRQASPFLDQDRALSGEITEVAAMVRGGAFAGLIPAGLWAANPA